MPSVITPKSYCRRPNGVMALNAGGGDVRIAKLCADLAERRRCPPAHAHAPVRTTLAAADDCTLKRDA